jgi:hypothetical protein
VLGFLDFADREGVSEKRTELRIPLMARVDVLWVDAEGTPRITPATLEDRSHGGMSVRTRDAIRIGSHITLKWGSEQVSGIVTNCRRQKADYILGVKREAAEEREKK